MRAAREAWFSDQLGLDPDALVYIDETAAATNMARTYGRAPHSERCRILVPQGHYKFTTVTAALRTGGLVATPYSMARLTVSASEPTSPTSWSRC